jgi:DNA ligase (NAD+)
MNTTPSNDPYPTLDEHTAALIAVQEAAAAYYHTGELLLDDDTYDQMRIRVLAGTANGWPTGNVDQIAAGTHSNGGDGDGIIAGGATHTPPMLSLDNTFNNDDTDTWVTRLRKLCGTDNLTYVVEPKLDGLALTANYVNGTLTLIGTRGDGTVGDDVTINHRILTGLPAQLPEPVTVTVRGEAVITDTQFATANQWRINDDRQNAFANPRNAAAGLLRRRSEPLPPAGIITFCAYSAHNHPPFEEADHTDVLATLTRWGITTSVAVITHPDITLGVAGDDTILETSAEQLRQHRGQLGVAIDGAVYKLNRTADRTAAGSGSTAPRWAIARKLPADTRPTLLNDIVVSVGRTGALSVRAVLEPVAVAGTTITSATLSNMSEIARKDLRIGDTVWVRRAGDVIPEITSVDLNARPADSIMWEPPAQCPRCGHDIDRTLKVWRCVRGRACGAAEQIRYAVGRDALDIDGFGDTLIDALVAAGHITDIGDVFSLDAATLTSMPRVGDISASNVLAAIDQARTQPWVRVLTALGLRGTGRRICRLLAGTYRTAAQLQAATVTDLAELDKIGPVKAQLIVAEVAAVADIIAKLAAAGVNLGDNDPVTEPVMSAAAASSRYNGAVVCVTGAIPGHTRDSAHALLESLGATIASSVSKKTTFLIVGGNGGSKVTKAEALGVTVIDAADFVTETS